MQNLILSSWWGDFVSSVWNAFSGPNASVKEVLDPYWPALVLGTITALIATPIARVLAFRLKILDIPDDAVKTHKEPTAYLGGVAVLTGFLVAAFVGSSLIFGELADPCAVRIIYAICGGAALATLVGLIDDLKDITPWQKLFGQSICALFLALAGIKPDLQLIYGQFGITLNPIAHDVISYFLILFFVLGATNSLNLLDGLDGLCAGVTAIITIGFLLLAIHLATWGTNPTLDAVGIVVGLALVGAVFGFLIFNRHPAAIFLGDAGTIFLGFVIASMMMIFAAQNPRWWLASIAIFGLPILDTATALIRRFLNKRPLFVSDRGHIYDQMLDRGMTLERTVDINYLLAAMYVCIGLASAIFIRTRIAIVIYIVVAVASLLIVWRKGYFKMRGLRGAVGPNRE